MLEVSSCVVLQSRFVLALFYLCYDVPATDCACMRVQNARKLNGQPTSTSAAPSTLAPGSPSPSAFTCPAWNT